MLAVCKVLFWHNGDDSEQDTQITLMDLVWEEVRQQIESRFNNYYEEIKLMGDQG